MTHKLRRFLRFGTSVAFLSLLLAGVTEVYRLAVGAPLTEMRRNLIASVLFGVIVTAMQMFYANRIRKHEEKMPKGGRP